jgi:hypothetical protein
MSSAVPRCLVHARSIRIDAHARADGLGDVDAVWGDTKVRDVSLTARLRQVGGPAYEMRSGITAETHLNIFVADKPQALYPGFLGAIGPVYRKLIGLHRTPDIRCHVREQPVGLRGYNPPTELATVLPAAARPGFAGEVFHCRDHSQGCGDKLTAKPDKEPFQLDRCRTSRTGESAVARFYPRWRSAVPVESGSDE